MRKPASAFLKSSFLIAAAFSFTACVSTSTSGVSSGKNEVFVLGSIHGAMLSQPKYSLREFVAALDAFRPDLILTESRMDHPGPIEGSIDGGIEQSVVYAYGTLTNVPVQAVDWFEDNLLDQVRAESAKESQALKQKTLPLNRLYEKQLRTASFLELQSPKTQNLVRKIYTTYEQGGSTLSLKRNQKICENISSSLKLVSGKRVAIVFGLDHKYYLEDCVRKLGANVVPASAFVDSSKLSSFVVPETLKNQAVTNIQTSSRYLKQELERGRYKGAMQKQLEAKLTTFPNWVEGVNAL